MTNFMKKILLSLGTLAIVGVVVVGATGAWFTNTETSTGNTFTAGTIDLKVGNDSYATNNDGVLAASPSTSWGVEDLNKGQLFFNFNDLKPGDLGEDTIGLNVGNNPAWACMNLNITATPENGQTEPEAAVDLTAGPNQGELQKELSFVFWKDDGDNVLEEGEPVFWQKTIKGISDGGKIALADSQGGVLEDGAPLNAGETYHIGKAWCQGTLTLDPRPQDNATTSGPLVRGTGVSCDGSAIGDASQTDGVKADVSFTVEQSRHNDNFLCNPPEEGSLTIVKKVSGGDINADQFNLYIDGNTSDTLHSGDTRTVVSGDHTVSEGSYSDYTQSFSANCPNGAITVPANGNATCTITNTYTKGNLTVTKIVNGGPYANDPNHFDLVVIDGNSNSTAVLSGVSKTFPEGSYTVSENSDSDYAQSFGTDCSNGTVTVPANGTATCTITNTYKKGYLKVVKEVVGSTANPDSFVLKVDGDIVVNGATNDFSAGSHTVTEGNHDGYIQSFSSNCDGGNATVTANETTTCTVTNTYDMGTLVVEKIVVNDNGGNETTSSFNLFMDGNSETFGDGVSLVAGPHTVSETAKSGVGAYVGTYSGACDSNGNVTVTANATSTCTITNNDLPASITLTKVVTGGGPLGSQDFNMTINGNHVDSGLAKAVDSNYANVIDETPVAGYSFVSITGDSECPSSLGGTATLYEGQNIACTITNTYTGTGN